jgi:plastocyanin
MTVFARPARADALSSTSQAPGASQAARAASRVVRASADERGVTLVLELETAPFPAPGSAHRDPTVLVFVPHHHRVGPGESVSFVVHFHGHNTTAERAMAAHELREQLFDSKQNAILVVPELAVMAADSSAGKLEAPGSLARMLEDVLTTLQSHEARSALGASAPFVFATVGRVCVSAHSGGYHAAACAVRHGGVRIQEVWLFDALYGDTDAFRDWVITGSGQAMSSRHKLVSYFTSGTTETNTNRLFSELEKAGVGCVHEIVEGTLSREQLTHAEAVSIRSQVAHGTVTMELNSLRDCLYASALRRRLRTSWFDVKQGARPLERRR